MVIDAFPMCLRNDLIKVLEKTSFITKNHSPTETSETYRLYKVGEREVKIPYRVYFIDQLDSMHLNLDKTQTLIVNCIQSRNADGFVREKHLKKLLSTELQEWSVPFVVASFDDYVLEILETIYQELGDKDTRCIKDFCRLNLHEVKKSYDRMISYWDCYYRWKSKRLNEYVGYKIFETFAGLPSKGRDRAGI